MAENDRWTTERGPWPLRSLWDPQHRTTLYLMLNQAIGAMTGLAFWFLLARVAGLPPGELGIGYSVLALGTAVGLVAKGGLDTALIRTVPGAHRLEGVRLLRFGVLLGTTVALLVASALAVTAGSGDFLADLSPESWILVALVAVLLVVTWLQDAYFLGGGDPRATFRRNLVFSGARLALPVPIVLLALPAPVPLTWALALVASTLAGIVLARRIPGRAGSSVPRSRFLRCAARNMAGNAAEILPGLLLVPLVLAVSGAESAGYFGMAWTAASLLFLATAAVGRSALVSMSHDGVSGRAVRRGALQCVALIGPAALVGVLFAEPILWIFGPEYATTSATAFRVLCASTVFVAPAFLYLAVLRAEERPLPLVLFPLALVAALFVLAPFLTVQAGITGVAVAWLLANAPFGAYAAWRLVLIREVRKDASMAVDRRTDVE